MITGYPTIETAVKAVKFGAEEYLSKPFTDTELFSAVEKVFEKVHHHRMTRPTWHRSQKSLHGFIGESGAMQNVF